MSNYAMQQELLFSSKITSQLVWRDCESPLWITPLDSAAWVCMQDIGALEPRREKLTLLGRHLAALPLPPRVGKLLLYGVLFRCLDPVLTIACAMAFRYGRDLQSGLMT